MGLFEKIGTISEFTIMKQHDKGYILDAPEVLHLITDKEYDIGQKVKVFVYFKSNQYLASLELPEATVDTYGWADVVEVDEEKGVMVDIGTSKTILIGRADLPTYRTVWPMVGDQLLIYLKTDKIGLLYGKCISIDDMGPFVVDPDETARNREVLATVLRSASVGSWAITQEGYFAFLHVSERQDEPRLGQLIRARIIDVKDDGTVNLSMLPRKEERLEDDAEVIYAYLLQRGGNMPYHDKSDPDEIRNRFSMSKASFKRALGTLMKQGKIIQENGWTKINESTNNHQART